MFMETLFVFLSILLLLAQNSEHIVGGHTEISDLHQDDVDGLNAMVRGLRMSNQPYSRTSCSGTTKGGSSDNIFCSCEFNNNTVCRVTFIDFSGQHLRGVIPSEVGNLVYLRGLNLSNNKIHGTIPNTLKNLSKLHYIHLGQNNMEGPIPAVFGDMKYLKQIDLSDNWFNGTIPPVFASLPVLQILYLDNNLLSGGIPPEIGNRTSLLQLHLSDNRLSGELPQELGNLVDLTDLCENEQNPLSNIETSRLTDNEFSGKLPQSFEALKNLVSLLLRGNNFSGKIPEYIAKWEKLKKLELMGNNFETPLPSALSSLNLSWLSVSNLLDSSESRDFEFPNISRMTFLEHLTLRNCSINGPIPEFFGRMASLRYLDLSFNNLTGDIPTFINDHQNLHHIYLKGNHLSGSVPAWLVDSTNSYVDISENNFTSIPVQLGGNWTNVNSFACCENSANLSTTWQRRDYYCHSSKSLYDHLYINCGGDRMLSNGVYYEADTQPYGESTFFLSEDKNWGYSSMGTFLGTDHNRYTHKSRGIDTSIYNTARVSPISLKYYGFCMKNGNYEVRLLFAEILYDEEKDHSSKGKRYFDIKIQDKKVRENFNIKEAAMGKTARVPLAFNTTVKNHRLEIHLYWNGNGSIRSPMEYYGPLISGISVSPVPRKSGIKLSAVTVAALVGCAILFLALLIFVFLWKVGFLGGKHLRDGELKGLELLPGGSFNFEQIKAATQNFNPLNKIGEGGFGSVYKGALPNGTPIAVKQLASKSKQGIREFVNELGTIFALQHPNLVKLLGCCTEDNQLVLVYEYMENNSLAHALFGPEELRLRLNWPTRFKICHGMAKGLAFLHEESKLKIVHRDIKPTNVLLDKDLNAKISDFGLAKLYETEHTHVITRIAGTTGYMAPEYAMRGYLTTKADVYSFGVVILEVVSGKSGTSYRPNDESVYLLDLAYVLQQKGDLISLVDPTLGSEYSLKQAMAILDLAMLCTNPSPTLRPTMSEVVKILEGKSKMKAHSFNVPYSTDDFAMAKAVAGLIPRTEFGSNSSGQTSNAVTYDVVSREEEENGIFGDCSSEIQDKTQSPTKMAS